MPETNVAYELAKTKFNDRFFIEKLTDSEDNKELIKSFNGGEHGKGLVNYLNDDSWKDMNDGDICVYLVKDRATKSIAAFFSLKSGLLCKPHGFESYSTGDRAFLNLIVEAKENHDDESLTNYKYSGMYSDSKFMEFIEQADMIIAQKQESEKRKAIYAEKTFSAVEIHDLCKNFDYFEDDSDNLVPMGMQTFWFGAIPIVLDVAQKVGCKYAYLFAADHDKENYKLVEYYRNNFKFDDASNKGLVTVKPRYDMDCIEMVSLISDIERNQYSIWERFSDLLEYTA